MLRIRALTLSLNVQSICVILLIWLSLEKDLSDCPIKKTAPFTFFKRYFFSNLFSIFLSQMFASFNMLFSFLFFALNNTVVTAKLIRETKPKLNDITSESAARRQTKVKWDYFMQKTNVLLLSSPLAHQREIKCICIAPVHLFNFSSCLFAPAAPMRRPNQLLDYHLSY